MRWEYVGTATGIHSSKQESGRGCIRRPRVKFFRGSEKGFRFEESWCTGLGLQLLKLQGILLHLFISLLYQLTSRNTHVFQLVLRFLGTGITILPYRSTFFLGIQFLLPFSTSFYRVTRVLDGRFSYAPTPRLQEALCSLLEVCLCRVM